MRPGSCCRRKRDRHERLDARSARRSTRFASAAPRENDTYDVGFTADLAGITALRLEVLGDDDLPEGGPGRGEMASSRSTR